MKITEEMAKVSVGHLDPKDRTAEARRDFVNQMNILTPESKGFLNKGAQVVAICSEPFSRGSVTLSSENPNEAPKVSVNYFMDQRDIEQQTKNVTVNLDKVKKKSLFKKSDFFLLP